MKEIWKTVEGFDLYEISNLGRLRAKDRIIDNHGGTYLRKAMLLKPIPDKYGYPCFWLKQDGKQKHAKIHRLVAQAFVPNPDNKPCVNHKDNDPSNPCADNLEWCTHLENTAWMAKQGRNKRTEQWLKALDQGLDPYRKAVIATDLITGEEITFRSVNDTRLHGFQPSCVSNCCRGKRPSHLGYQWRFAE